MSACDLHLHSHYSDGTWSPGQLINHAINLGMSVVSITDHDSVSGLAEAKQACGKNLDLINGVEISSRHRSKDRKIDLHLLGYFINPESLKLKEILEYNRGVRSNFARQLVGVLNSKGIPLTMDDINCIAGKGTIGASHMTKAIISCGVSGDIAHVYNRFFGKNKEIQIDRPWIAIEEAIQAINKAGGIAVLAHPGFDSTTEFLLSELKEMGLSGVEVYHSYHSKKDRNELISLADQLNLVVTGGSDCHGPYENSAPYMGAMNLNKALLKDFLSFSNSQ